MIQLVRVLLAFFVVGLTQALWLVVCVLASLLVTIGAWIVEKVKAFIEKYLTHLLVALTIAFLGVVFTQSLVNATQDAELRSVKCDAAWLRSENREDHKRIEDKLDLLLLRGK